MCGLTPLTLTPLTHGLTPLTQMLADRYRALGGPVTLRVVPGRGHDMWTGWFEDRELADFAIDRARRGVPAQPPPDRPPAQSAE